MRKCILLFKIATLLEASFCSTDSLFDLNDSGCALDEDETTREVCNKRNATASGYDCCLLSITVSEVKSDSCIAAKKSKAGKIVDEFKDEDLTKTAKVTLECESSMIKYFTLFSILSLFLF